MKTKTFSGILLLMALALILPSKAPAAVVGRITQVEGRVDLLKKGQLPATPVKLQDGLEKGDVIRTKSLSKAQITFVDKSTLTIAPESRIAIEEYMVDEGKGKRNAVLQMFQGLALTVVSKIYQSNEPDFVVKTQTAIMGIRGTEVGIRIYPNYAEFLDFKGRVRVQSILPEISGVVELGPDQGTRVLTGLPPTAAFVVSAGDKQQFMSQMNTGLITRGHSKDSDTQASGSAGSDLGFGNGSNFSFFTISPTLMQPTLTTATSLSSTNVISPVNTLPPSPIPPPVTGPPGTSGGGGPPSLTGKLPVGAPGLSGTTPGQSGSGPPGQIGTTPGLSGSGPPGAK